MTNVEKVRLRIGDADSLIFTTDAEIEEFLAANDDDILLSCADACRAIAAQAVLLERAVRIGNYSHDRKSAAATYMKLAEMFRGEVEDAPAYGFFEQTFSPFAEDDILTREAMRE